ncbi:MAG: AAA family ATPase [Planctomycetota bacterium]|nr:AAA family ATPase [Planctomycetota bacterium]
MTTPTGKNDSGIRPSAKRRDRGRIECKPIPLSEISETAADVEWLWHGWIARSFITLLIAHPKGGKTTLVSEFLKLISDGGELAGEIKKCRALVISEEMPAIWKQRLAGCENSKSIHFESSTFLMKPDQADWAYYCRTVAEQIEEMQIDLVIIDTWQRFTPARDENSVTETMTGMIPLDAIKQAGAAILLNHHSSKGGGAEGTASRGSSSLSGAVDIQIELKRTNPNSSEDRHRTMKGLGRFNETPHEVVIELTDDGYVAVGSRSDYSSKELDSAISEILQSESEAIDWEQVQSKLGDEKEISVNKSKLQDALKKGFENGIWHREGKGVKGSQYRYLFNSSTAPPVVDELNNPPEKQDSEKNVLSEEEEKETPNATDDEVGSI